MNFHPSPNNAKVAILGAGITGLSLAWHLQKLDPSLEITLFESSTKIGGVIQTDKVEGAFYERGPHTLRLSSPYKDLCLNLFKELGLSDKIYIPKNVSKKLLCYDHQLHELPSHPFHIFNFYYLKNLIWPLIKEPFRKKKKLSKNISIHAFFSERFGLEFARFFVDPIVTGIFGGDPKKLSMKACFPQIYNLQNSKSLLLSLLKQKKKNPSIMMTFTEGLSTLTSALQKQLNVEFKLGQKVLGLCLKDKPLLTIEKGNISFDYILSCLPANHLKNILPTDYVEIHSLLENFNALSYKVMHLGFSQPMNLPRSFGFLSPSWSEGKIQGVIFDSFVTPIHDSSKHAFRLTALISEKSPLFNQSSDDLASCLKKELEYYFKQPLNPIYENIYSFPNAITQYEVGHLEKVAGLKQAFEKQSKQFLFGGKSFYGGSVPACLVSGANMAKEFLNLPMAKVSGFRMGLTHTSRGSFRAQQGEC